MYGKINDIHDLWNNKYFVNNYLKDPESNKINQWDVSGFEMTQQGGVYVQQQIMSEQPVLGKWKLKAKLLSHEVREYI